MLKGEVVMLTNKRSAITRSKIMLNYDLLAARAVITLPEWGLNLEDIQQWGPRATRLQIPKPHSRRRDTKRVSQYKRSESKYTNHSD
jgi:hypothetical protein